MSKIIKSLHTVASQVSPKTIKVRNLFAEMASNVEDGESEEQLDLTTTSGHYESIMSNIEEKLKMAEIQAKQIIAQADDDAMKVREQLRLERQQADVEIERSIKDGHDQGYDEGFNQGQLDGQQTYEQKIKQAEQIINESEQEFEKTIDSADPVIVELAVALVKRMIGKNIEDQPEIWSSLLKQVMLEVREHEHVKLYVHPDWYVQTNGQKEELEQLLSHTEKLFIYPDAGLMENGCVVESQYGRIDATLDRQLQELKTQLLAKLEEGPYESRRTNE